MKVPEYTEEGDGTLTRAQALTQYHMLAFLDELTQLTRKYGIVISSEGNIDVPSLRSIDMGEAQTHAYQPFWANAFSYPMDFIYVEQTQHLIDL